MRKGLTYLCIFLTLLSGAMCISCTSDLDIKQVYTFELQTMPVQKSIKKGETIEMRCKLVKEGNYEDTSFFIRYFQPDGTGELKMDKETVFLPNDLYPLKKDTFRLYYTSRSDEQQTIDIYIEDNFGQVVQKSFSWQNIASEEEDSDR